MPKITGDNLAVKLMEIRPDIPVILFTGYSKRISDELAADIGIKAFAYKPISQNDLSQTVRKVLDEAKKIDSTIGYPILALGRDFRLALTAGGQYYQVD